METHGLADVAESLELVDLRASPATRPPSSRTRPAVRIATAACVGERRQQLRLPIANGSTRSRQADSTPMTTPSKSIGAPRMDRYGRSAGHRWRVLGVVEDVGDLLGSPIKADPADRGSAGRGRSGCAAMKSRYSSVCPTAAAERKWSPSRRWIWATSAWDSRPSALHHGPEHFVEILEPDPPSVRSTSRVAGSCSQGAQPAPRAAGTACCPRPDRHDASPS